MQKKVETEKWWRYALDAKTQTSLHNIVTKKD